MPKLTIEGEGTFEIKQGTRLVLAIEDAGIDIGHRCGGNARCTTCRVKFIAGEPNKQTQAGKERLQQGIDKGDEQLKTSRLSCQATLDHDMTVKVLMRVRDQNWDGPGRRPHEQITPEPEWFDRS
ncbi:MAG: 2Fe-2S iron-sulfur cluster-binding protein [Candidatus Kariarchaeaceae archaeon]|jgi:ferredoxin